MAKWKKREKVEDRKTGPRDPRSTVLSQEEEAVIVAFRRFLLLLGQSIRDWEKCRFLKTKRTVFLRSRTPWVGSLHANRSVVRA